MMSPQLLADASLARRAVRHLVAHRIMACLVANHREDLAMRSPSWPLSTADASVYMMVGSVGAIPRSRSLRSVRAATVYLSALVTTRSSAAPELSSPSGGASHFHANAPPPFVDPSGYLRPLLTHTKPP